MFKVRYLVFFFAIVCVVFDFVLNAMAITHCPKITQVFTAGSFTKAINSNLSWLLICFVYLAYPSKVVSVRCLFSIMIFACAIYIYFVILKQTIPNPGFIFSNTNSATAPQIMNYYKFCLVGLISVYFFVEPYFEVTAVIYLIAISLLGRIYLLCDE